MPLQVNPESGRLLMLPGGALMNECCCHAGPGPMPAPTSGLVVDDVFEIRESGCTLTVGPLDAIEQSFRLYFSDGVTSLDISVIPDSENELEFPDGPTKPTFVCRWWAYGDLTFGHESYHMQKQFIMQTEGAWSFPLWSAGPIYTIFPLSGVKLRVRAIYPARLTANINDYPRRTYLGGEWGPTANAPDEVRDLRQYTDAHLEWAFFPSDIPGAGTPCGATVEIYDSAIWRTVAHIGMPGDQTPQMLSSYLTIQGNLFHSGGPGLHSIRLTEIRQLSQSPQMHAAGSDCHETGTPPPGYRFEPGDFNVYGRAEDGSISLEITGDPVPGYRDDPPFVGMPLPGAGQIVPNMIVSFVGAPAHVYDVRAEGTNMGGINLPGGLITCLPYDGPAQWYAEENPQGVLHNCPLIYGADGVLDWMRSPPITLTMPGRWQQTARSYGASSGFIWPEGNVVHGWDVQEQGCAALGFVCDPGSLAAADYERNAWRLPIGLPLVGARWAAGEIALSPSHMIDDFTGGMDGWAAADANTTVAAVAGALRVTTTGATSSITKAPTSAEVDWTTGRYLVFEINTAGPVAGNTLTIGTKAWTFAAPGGTATVRLDLCAPTNRAGVDTTENREALEYPASIQGGWGWGIRDNPTLTFTFNTAATVTIDNIRLARAATEARHSSIVSEMIADLPTYLIEVTPYYQYGRRGLVHLVDGKVALDIHHGHMTINTDGTFGPVPYTIDSMLQTADDCNGKGLLTVTNLRPHGTPPFVRPDNHNQYFGDQSFYYAHQFCTNGQYGYQLLPLAYKWHEDSTEPVGLMAHLAADRISFGVGTACKPLTIRRMFGGGLAGVVADTTGALPGLLVDIRKGGTRRDSDTTDANGSYRTPRVARSLTKTGVFDITRAGGATPATLAFAEEGVLHRRSLP
jgi:hypothetical protein